MADLKATLGLDTREFDNGLKKATSSTRDFGRTFQRETSNALQLGKGLLSIEMMRKGWNLAAAAVREFSKENEEAARQVKAVEDAWSSLKAGVGKGLVQSGAVSLVGSALGGVEDFRKEWVNFVVEGWQAWGLNIDDPKLIDEIEAADKELAEAFQKRLPELKKAKDDRAKILADSSAERDRALKAEADRAARFRRNQFDTISNTVGNRIDIMEAQGQKDAAELARIRLDYERQIFAVREDADLSMLDKAQQIATLEKQRNELVTATMDRQKKDADELVKASKPRPGGQRELGGGIGGGFFSAAVFGGGGSQVITKTPETKKLEDIHATQKAQSQTLKRIADNTGRSTTAVLA